MRFLHMCALLGAMTGVACVSSEPASTAAALVESPTTLPDAAAVNPSLVTAETLPGVDTTSQHAALVAEAFERASSRAPDAILAAIVGDSEVAALVRCVTTSARLTSGEVGVVTDVSLRVDRQFRGADSPAAIVIPGGYVGSEGFANSNAPLLQSGMDYLIFGDPTEGGFKLRGAIAVSADGTIRVRGTAITVEEIATLLGP